MTFFRGKSPASLCINFMVYCKYKYCQNELKSCDRFPAFILDRLTYGRRCREMYRCICLGEKQLV